MRRRIHTPGSLATGIVSLALVFTAAGARAGSDKDVPRTSDGHPDLSGTYDIATLTSPSWSR